MIRYTFASTQIKKDNYQHVLDGRVLYIMNEKGEIVAKINGHEQLKEMIKAIECKVVAT
jgi:hypothetical protein